MNDDEFKKLQNQARVLSEALQKISGGRSNVRFAEYARSYLEEKLANPTLRESTKRAFRNQIERHLVPAFGDLELEEITNRKFLQWVSAHREKNTNFRFFNSRKYLVEVLLAAKASGILERAPKFDNPDVERNVGRALSPREIFRILKGCRSSRFRFIFYVFYKHGCRPQEILRWEWSFFDWNEPGKTWINIPARITKTGRARRIPINPSVSARLFEMRHLAGASPFVFPDPSNPGKPELRYTSPWKSACKRAGVIAVPYDLRRTFASRAAAAGMPLLYLARLLDTSVKLLESTYAKESSDAMEDIIK